MNKNNIGMDWDVYMYNKEVSDYWNMVIMIQLAKCQTLSTQPSSSANNTIMPVAPKNDLIILAIFVYKTIEHYFENIWKYFVKNEAME